MTLRSTARVFFSLSVATWFAEPAIAQSVCSEGRVGRIVIERLDVFETPGEPEPESLLLGLGNAIHMRTSESFIRGELLFEPGDCYDPFLASESERILRSRSIIKEASITSERLADGSVQVRVRTQDDWSLSISFGISFDEGLKFEGIGASENNFLGRGVSLGVTRSTDREFQELGGLLGATRFLGTPFALSLGSGETRVGPYVDQGLERPFLSELGRFAIRQEFSIRDDNFAYSLGESAGTTHVLLPYEQSVLSLTGAFRTGGPGGLWLFGAGLSRHTLDYAEGLTTAEVVIDDEFGSPAPASDAERMAIEAQAAPLAATRLNTLFGFRRVSFAVREGLDGIRAVQDVKVGTEGVLTLGRSISGLGRPGDANDLYARFDLFGGMAPGPLVVSGDAFIEGRRGLGDDPAAGLWRDVVAQIDTRVYWKPLKRSGHTMLARVKAAGAWSMDRPFQLTGGGREGVRGYSRDAYPGASRLLLTLEDRSVLLTRTALDVGLAIFGDLGQMWAGDVPYGADSGWKASVGLGFRVSLPGGTVGATRFDFTLPLSGDRERNGVYFRFYTELGALLRSIDGRGQVDRSRWSGIDGDLTARSSR